LTKVWLVALQYIIKVKKKQKNIKNRQYYILFDISPCAKQKPVTDMLMSKQQVQFDHVEYITYLGKPFRHLTYIVTCIQNRPAK